MKIGDRVVTPKGTGFITDFSRDNEGVKAVATVDVDGQGTEWFPLSQVWAVPGSKPKPTLVVVK